MQARDLVCWKCGGSLAELSLPLRRLEECPACGADLHVCRMCEFYDERVAKKCREPVADEVKDKERANFCDYLRPRADAFTAPEHGAAHQAHADLEALFGLRGAPGEAPKGAPMQADEARSKLEQLFDLDDKSKE